MYVEIPLTATAYFYFMTNIEVNKIQVLVSKSSHHYMNTSSLLYPL